MMGSITICERTTLLPNSKVLEYIITALSNLLEKPGVASHSHV